MFVIIRELETKVSLWSIGWPKTEFVLVGGSLCFQGESKRHSLRNRLGAKKATVRVNFSDNVNQSVPILAWLWFLWHDKDCRILYWALLYSKRRVPFAFGQFAVAHWWYMSTIRQNLRCLNGYYCTTNLQMFKNFRLCHMSHLSVEGTHTT